MQWSAFLLQVNLYHLFGVVPASPRIGHEYRLEQAEHGYGNQVGYEQRYRQIAVLTRSRRCQAGKGDGEGEDGDKDVEHALLRILGADLDHFFGFFYGGLLAGFLIQTYVLLDVFHRPVGPGGDRLGGGPGEPVDDAAPGDEAEDGEGV